MKPQQKAKEKPNYSVLQNVLWMISVAWRTRKRTLLYTVLIAVLEILRNVTQLYISPQILQRVEQHSPLGELLSTIAFFTLALFLLTGIKEYITTISIFPRIDVRMTLVGDIGRKNNTTAFINTLDQDFIRLGEKARLATNGNYAASEQLWVTLGAFLQNVGGFVVYLTILSELNGWMLATIIATCAAGFFAARYANDRIYQSREESERLYAKKTYIRRQSESITMAKDIRIFGLQNWLSDLFDSVHNAYLHWRLGNEKLYLLADLTEVVLTVARNGIAYVFLISMAIRENLSVSEFLLYFTAVTTFTQWVMGILQKSSELHKHSLDLCGVRDFLNWPEPYKFDDGEKVPEANSYELKLENVSFRYPGAETNTITGLNLTVHPGEKLAIVGLNGAGKTTVVKLLCGLFDPTEGRVLLGGKDIRDFDRREYYKLFGAVFQEFSVLEATIAENVAQTQEDIDLDRVRDCIEKAGLTEMVEKLPDGLNTHVGREVWLDGVLFSGGQTQRLMLARALYKNAPILLLDEPTAALDPIAENDIYLKYDSMTRGKLSLFISHRLASTRFCDRIIYVDNGSIAEEGTHETLLKQGGKYAELYEIQSRYYQEGREF